jgi:hypothetical protein
MFVAGCQQIVSNIEEKQKNNKKPNVYAKARHRSSIATKAF